MKSREDERETCTFGNGGSLGHGGPGFPFYWSLLLARPGLWSRAVKSPLTSILC